MSKGIVSKRAEIKIGDLVTYRSIREFSLENLQQKIAIHGVGIVITIDDEYCKVYWIHARDFLWIFTNKLTTIQDLP